MKKLTKSLVVTALITSMFSTVCSARELSSSTLTGTTDVIVDTTKTMNSGGSLPDSFTYKVTIPAAMTLEAATPFTSLDASSEFRSSGNVNVIVKGVATSGKYIKISVASSNTEDSGCNITLKTTDGKKTSGGKFSFGGEESSFYTANSASDKTAMLSSSGLSIPLSISGVKGITDFGEFIGGLDFTISEEV